jgi:bacteriorhodopsin
MVILSEGGSLLATITTALFLLGFVGMAAGSLYFILERNELKAGVRSVAIYAAVIAAVAAVLYFNMLNLVLDGNIGATVPLRYIDWVITTPLLLLEFGLIAAMVGKLKKGLISRLVIADLIMIITGFLGEISAPGSIGAYIFFIISVLAWIWIIVEVFGVKSSGKGFAASAVTTMKWFVIIGWSIYPLGTAIQQFMSLGKADMDTLTNAALVAACVYVVADLVNKVVFGIVAVRAAKNS